MPGMILRMWPSAQWGVSLPSMMGQDGRAVAHTKVELRRSARRRRTVSAYRQGDLTIVLLPAGLSSRDENQCVSEVLAALRRRESRRGRTDQSLPGRAEQLSTRYLGGLAKPTSVRWVTNQRTRWGSCSPATRTIRLSHRLQSMPEYVVDYVLLHELAHLLVPGHGPSFWALLAQYPQLDKARGFLEGAAWAPDSQGEAPEQSGR